MKYNKRADLKRIINATKYSLKGLKSAYIYEAAFRQEVWCCCIFIPLGFIFGDNAIEKSLLVASVLLVLIVELINSAIEAVVDRVGCEFNELSGRAKDMGSSAVFISIILAFITWFIIFLF
ncbi:diacylglycerol kinase [Campylobacter pinnipediorum]|uniref:Diacylglycerol kinase n=1 Tax=Campylobacter pinnipediorum subsp. pinnipediorum TaxID=1660067 RepID=A0AAX0L9F6_9BACT|nr:diacylglycerol kinase [Campylobacter pinnipediorum]AQW80572.1 diacylglycerol kinase [Campylobacter pinnipediorum subsp. pinnipediorum]AQW82241.1 diacylglycerol kinase [Campylobacter pinnipediorum subsp. pinnipediorum]AQW83918.1 diacylglycerol kinase [Campylobacter pinnipediorum subsp. pinnipediorum]OPA74923.1 diacylglycerol kinase [Campylobacter pinnipediorum subsp. pinnipediorum]OPA75048.1 diacylglycerol kinase [Campylobacter pinnipediorum subsp. pinnipediorum]